MTLLLDKSPVPELALIGQIHSLGGPMGLKPTPIGRGKWKEFLQGSHDPLQEGPSHPRTRVMLSVPRMVAFGVCFL